MAPQAAALEDFSLTIAPGETVAVTREQSQSPHFIQASRARKSAPAEAPAESEAAV